MPFFPQLVARRAMTTELTHYLIDLNLPDEDLIESISTFTDPSKDLLEWCAGGPPRTPYDSSMNNHPIAHCGQLNPIRDSPWLPLLDTAQVILLDEQNNWEEQGKINQL